MLTALVTFIGSIFGAVGSGIGAFFGFKTQQAVSDALITTTVAHADVALANASVQALQDAYVSGPPIERLWRPIAMWTFLILIVLQWCGIVPVHWMPQGEIQFMYNCFYCGLIGYIPCRSLDKWMKYKYGPSNNN